MSSPALIVTGASGLIGVKTVEALARDQPVFALDAKPPRRVPKGATYIPCDFTRDSDVDHAFDEVARRAAGVPIASLIHLATHYDFSGGPSPLYRSLTVDGTRRLLRALRSFAVEQVLFSSSLWVMKPVADEAEVITESSPIEATWDYPTSMIEAETVLQQERGSIPALILRVAGVYDDKCHSLPIAHHIHRIREKAFESYFFPGDTNHGQPFVHLDDLVECFQKAVQRRSQLAPLETLLIAEPDVMTYQELQDEIGTLLHGKEWPTIRVPAPLAKAEAWLKEKWAGPEDSFIKPWMIDLADAHYPVSIGRAHRLLTWDPKRRLRNTLPLMIGRLFQDPKGWYQENELPCYDDVETTEKGRHV